MRRLFLTHRSPYARKVSLQLLRRGLQFEEVLVDLGNRSPEFVAISPIGKVPVLQDEDGTVVFDSTVICEYLADRYGDDVTGWQSRLARRQLDELGDGLGDQAIAIFFGRQGGANTDKAERVAARLLGALEATVPAPLAPFGATWTWGDDAVFSSLGYWNFRLGDSWRAAHPRLSAWVEAVDATPEGTRTRPRG